MGNGQKRSRWVTGSGAAMVSAALCIGTLGSSPVLLLGLLGSAWLGYGIANRI